MKDRYGGAVLDRGAFLQLHVDVAADLAAGIAQFGGQRVGHACNHPRRLGVVEAGAGTVAGLGLAERDQNLEAAPQHRQHAGIPAGADHCRHAVTMGGGADRLVVRVARAAFDRRALHHRQALLQEVERSIGGDGRGHAEQGRVRPLGQVPRVGGDRRAHRARRALAGAHDDARQLQVGRFRCLLGAGAAQPPVSDDRKPDALHLGDFAPRRRGAR